MDNRLNDDSGARAGTDGRAAAPGGTATDSCTAAPGGLAADSCDAAPGDPVADILRRAKLVLPCMEYMDQYVQMCREYRDAGVGYFMMQDPDNFDAQAFLKEQDDWRHGRNLPEGYVPSTKFWTIVDGTLVGAGNLRHTLSDSLRRMGGHIGYGIRPPFWGKGYGTAQLRLLLDEAAKLGIDCAMTTCDETNIGSARVMEHCGARHLRTIDYDDADGSVRRVKHYECLTRRLHHTGTVTLDTPRLTLRRLKLSDAEPMYRNWASNPNVPRFLGWEPHASVEASRGVLEKWVAEYENEDCYHWGIVHKELGEPIGTINAHALSKKDLSCELGYGMGEAWWGQGVMSEAAQAVIDHLFGVVGFNRIDAYHDVDNPGSGGVMRKIGMQQEGCLRQRRRRKDGGFADHLVWAILREEWEKQRA